MVIVNEYHQYVHTRPHWPLYHMSHVFFHSGQHLRSTSGPRLSSAEWGAHRSASTPVMIIRRYSLCWVLAILHTTLTKDVTRIILHVFDLNLPRSILLLSISLVFCLKSGYPLLILVEIYHPLTHLLSPCFVLESQNSHNYIVQLLWLKFQTLSKDDNESVIQNRRWSTTTTPSHLARHTFDVPST